MTRVSRSVRRCAVAWLGGAFALLLTAAPLAATVYYVSAGGNDLADGLSPGSAWRTLQHAADTVVAGDTVVVLDGTYTGFNLFRSGTPQAPITFTARPGPAGANPAVVIDRPNGFTGRDYINLEGASHVVVEGFTILGSGDPATSRAGIRSVGFDDAFAAGNTFRFNRCDRPGVWGIFTGFVDDLLIEGNETSRAVDEHGIYVSNSGDRPLIRDNLVWGNHANGIHLNGDASLGGDGVISGALIERNVIFGNGAGGGSGINGDGLVDSVIRNNLLYDNHASGISLYQIDGGAPSTGNLVVDNTVLVAADGRWAMNIQDGSSGNTLRNNIFWSDHPSRGAIDLCAACLPGFSSDHNALEDRLSLDDVWIDLATWRALTGQDLGSLTATPAELFVSPADFDYRLPPGSPAVDAGTAEYAPPADLVGVARPQGGGFDIGAYERVVELGLWPPRRPLAGQQNGFTLRGATPGAHVALVGGLLPGATPVPGCPGLELAITAPRPLATGTADLAGEAVLTVTIPGGAGGRTLLFQGVERSTCRLSPRLDVAFP